jgi:hypothetical protein
VTSEFDEFFITCTIFARDNKSPKCLFSLVIFFLMATFTTENDINLQLQAKDKMFDNKHLKKINIFKISFQLLVASCLKTCKKFDSLMFPRKSRKEAYYNLI